MTSIIEIKNELLGNSFYEIVGFWNSNSLDKNINTEPSEQKYRENSQDEQDIVSVHRGQVENPTYTITGYIDKIGNMDDGEIGYKELLTLYRNRTKDTYLRIKLDGHNTPSSGFQVPDFYGNQNSDGIKVEVKSISISPREPSSALEQHIISYEIVLKEDANDV